MEEAASSPDIEGVVLIMSFPWYSKREWNEETTLHEKHSIAEKINELGFNKVQREGVKSKFLIAVSGDTHMLAYDTGFHNIDGGFPIF